MVENFVGFIVQLPFLLLGYIQPDTYAGRFSPDASYHHSLVVFTLHTTQTVADFADGRQTFDARSDRPLIVNDADQIPPAAMFSEH